MSVQDETAPTVTRRALALGGLAVAGAALMAETARAATEAQLAAAPPGPKPTDDSGLVVGDVKFRSFDQEIGGYRAYTKGSPKGLPVIVSQHIGNVVALVNASDIFLGDEGGVAVDMSREASIEMRSAGLGMDATAGTATAASVSMFQTNSVALRAEREINWKRARASAVAYLTSVDWGGAVPAS